MAAQREFADTLREVYVQLKAVTYQGMATRAGFHALALLLQEKQLITSPELANRVAGFARDAYGGEEELAGVLDATMDLAEALRSGLEATIVDFPRPHEDK